MRESIAIAAILRQEDEFVDEWIVYHQMIGVMEFLLYDDDPRQHLREHLEPYGDLVRVFDWTSGFHLGPGRNRQTKAYEHSLHITQCAWISFIDIDEFIALKQHETIEGFLSNFSDASCVILSWHMFGHCGHYETPPLITQSLLRRQAAPGRMMKSIVRPERVERVLSAHRCAMKHTDLVLDANHRVYTEQPYPGKSNVANINHYFCRSYINWMNRVQRGEVAYSPIAYPRSEAWRFEQEQCLRKFVEISAVHNELVDDFMLKYGTLLLARLSASITQRIL